MNSNVTRSIVEMESGELSELVKEVKETVATNVNPKQVFSAADLWNIQKSMRTAQSGRRIRNIQA
jgi:hypothetical protein